MYSQNKEAQKNYDIARLYLEEKKLDEALFYYTRAVFFDKNFTQAYFDRAVVNLLKGNIYNGLKDYEKRLNFKGFIHHLPVKYPKKLKDLKDKNILIFWEQGFGDSINFFPYIKKLRKYSKNITFLVQPPLENIFKISYPKYNIISKLQSSDFDYVIPLLSIPYILNLANFKAKKSYLKVKNSDLDYFKRKYNLKKDILNIGICWAGTNKGPRDKYRSIDIENFKPFFNLAKKYKIRFFSLQKDIRTNIKYLDDIAIDFNDFYDTAVAIKSMDIVISVDTSVVHLSGALGVKTYLLLPYLPDFRWGLDSNKSQFYKSVKIIRQDEKLQWQKPLDLLKKELYKKLNISNIVLFRSYSGDENNKHLIRIGDFMAYMIIANYFKTIEKKYLVLSLTSLLSKNFKADILFKNLFDEIYIDKVPLNITDQIFDPDKTDGLWALAPLLYQKYGNKILPKVAIKKSVVDNIFTNQTNYIVFNPLVSANYNIARNMDRGFINFFANKLYKKFGKKLIILTDKDDLIENKKIKTVLSSNLYDIFYLIANAKVFIGGDTGFSHFAGLSRVPKIVTLYGTVYPTTYNNTYFNANVIYDKTTTKLQNYILKNNMLQNENVKKIISFIS